MEGQKRRPSDPQGDDNLELSHPDTELAVKGTKATLLVEKLRGYIRHEYIWVVNSEGVAL